MNIPLRTFTGTLVDDVREYTAKSIRGSALIAALEGIHPIDIKRALIDAGEEGLFKDAFQDVIQDPSAIREIIREDNPVLSFWPFAIESCHAMAQRVAAYESVALLGAPTLLSPLSRNRHRQITLFEKDEYWSCSKHEPSFVKCDLGRDSLLTYENSFDAVVADPPWYLEEYNRWLRTALRLVRPGGLILFSLFGPRVRESAREERNEIIQTARNFTSELSISVNCITYDTSSFEQVQFIRSGLMPINWRRADLMAGLVSSKPNHIPSNKPLEDVWLERRIGCGRVFIKLTPSEETNFFLETADPSSRFLSSPSKRDVARRRSNVISSRGHGLRCRDPRRLLDMIESIRTWGEIERVSARLDDVSKEIFELFAYDLWPRVMRI